MHYTHPCMCLLGLSPFNDSTQVVNLRPSINAESTQWIVRGESLLVRHSTRRADTLFTISMSTVASPGRTNNFIWRRLGWVKRPTISSVKEISIRRWSSWSSTNDLFETCWIIDRSSCDQMWLTRCMLQRKYGSWSVRVTSVFGNSSSSSSTSLYSSWSSLPCGLSRMRSSCTILRISGGSAEKSKYSIGSLRCDFYSGCAWVTTDPLGVAMAGKGRSRKLATLVTFAMFVVNSSIELRTARGDLTDGRFLKSRRGCSQFD